jgi:hypothetical protein
MSKWINTCYIFFLLIVFIFFIIIYFLYFIIINDCLYISGTYSQYRQASVQPVRLVVEPGYDEPPSKPNASPRPSILRKRDHDGSPIKGNNIL